MLRLAANLTFLFTELPMLERFAAARRAGFDGVEVLFPYDLAAKDLAAACQAAGLEFVLLNTPPPNWSGGPRGFAATPGGEDRFRRDFDRSLRFAQALRSRHLHVMAGKAEGPTALRTLVDNLKWACERAPHASLLIEPINTRDRPNYFLNRIEQAADIIGKVGRPNVKIQFDFYHVQIVSGDLIKRFEAHQPLVGHVQIAAVPTRAEPDEGEINYPAVFEALDRFGWSGWTACEYKPRARTEDGLGWGRKYGLGG